MFLEDARRAYEDGGPGRLDAFLKRLKSHTEAEYFLTDGRGIDLVTGEDRSAVRSSGVSVRRPPLSRGFCPAPRQPCEFAAPTTASIA